MKSVDRNHNCIFRKILVLLLTFSLASGTLLGCANTSRTDVEEGQTSVYFLNTEETKLEAHGRYVEGSTPEEQVDCLLQYMAETPEKLEYKAPLSYGFSVLSGELKDGRLTLEMSEDYLKLSPTTEILIRAAIVKSLCQIEGIRFVSFTVQGEAVTDATGRSIGWMSESSFINNDGNEINTFDEVKVKLFFAAEDGVRLIGAYREKFYSTNISMERFIVDELIAGPSGQIAGLYATINSETKVLSVNTKDRVCYVNLDSGFLTAVNNVTTETAIYSIVNSLVELNYIDKVQILVNGEVPVNFTSSVYEQNTEIVTTLDTIAAEAAAAAAAQETEEKTEVEADETK